MGEIQHLVRDLDYTWNNGRWIRYALHLPITSIVDITANDVLFHKDKRQHLPTRTIIFFPHASEKLKCDLYQIIKPFVSHNFIYAEAPYYFDYEGSFDNNLQLCDTNQMTLVVTGIELDSFCLTCRAIGKVISIHSNSPITNK
jgi:hypothetical protein